MIEYKKISGLSAATSVASDDAFEVVNGGDSAKASLTVIAESIVTESAMTDAFAAKSPSAATGATVVRTFLFDIDSEIDVSSELTDGMSAQTTTFAGVPSAAVAVLVGVTLQETTDHLRWISSANAGASNAVNSIRVQFGGNSGTQVFRGTFWLRTDGNSVYTTVFEANVSHRILVLGYMAPEA